MFLQFIVRLLFTAVIIILCCVVIILPSSLQGALKQDSLKVYDIQQAGISTNVKTLAVKSSSPLQIVTNTDFKRYGLYEVADAVRLFSGVTVKDYGGVGGLKTVSVRNMGVQHTVIAYDGIAINDLQSGQIDIGRFTLNHVEQLSLIIGMSDDIFLPARMTASAAVLSINTRRRELSTTPYGGYVQCKIGSFGFIQPSIYHTHKISKIVTLTASADFVRANGNYPFTIKNGIETLQLKRENSDILSGAGELNVYLQLAPQHTVDTKLYYFQSDRGLPGAVTLYNPYARERLKDLNYFIQSLYQNKLSEHWQLKVAGKYHYGYNKYTDEKLEYQQQIVDNRYLQQEYYLSGVIMFIPYPFLSFSVAQDVTYNLLDSNLDSPFEAFAFPRRLTAQTALSGQYKIKRLTLSANLLSSYITEQVRNGNPSKNLYRLNPAISVSYKLLPHHNLYIRTGYKHIFRPPTFNELYYSVVGNRNLKPEKTQQVNLGMSYQQDFNNQTTHLSIQADGYYNNVIDKLVTIPTTFIWKVLNFGKVAAWGTDINATIEQAIVYNMNLLLSGNYSYQRAIDITLATTKNYKHQLPYVPQHSGHVSLSAESPWINLSYTIIGSGKRYSASQNIPTNLLQPYIDHSLSANHTFNLFKYKLRLQLDLLNLTNKHYQVIQYYPMQGRSLRATIQFNY